MDNFHRVALPTMEFQPGIDLMGGRSGEDGVSPGSQPWKTSGLRRCRFDHRAEKGGSYIRPLRQSQKTLITVTPTGMSCQRTS
jgi:hypothetical protein